MNALVCYGTRPEFIKIKPLITEFENKQIKFRTLCIRQHTSLIGDGSEATYDVDVPDGLNRLDGLLATANVIPNVVFESITHVLVQGDTATALVCALAAFHRNIPVIHLEAGLRTYDAQNPYPEETYRQLISRIASIHLCPTKANAKNLFSEKIKDNVFVVGNTVLDNLLSVRNNTTHGNEVLVTLHRRENHPIMDQWFTQLDLIAEKHKEFKFVLPIHPNPNVQKHRGLLKHVNVIDPLPYDLFINRLLSCALAISDSGGIQEEASFLGKKVIVCRTTTERPESLNKTSFLCKEPTELEGLFDKTITKVTAKKSDIFGDGFAARNIVEVLGKLNYGN